MELRAFAFCAKGSAGSREIAKLARDDVYSSSLLYYRLSKTYETPPYDRKLELYDMVLWTLHTSHDNNRVKCVPGQCRQSMWSCACHAKQGLSMLTSYGMLAFYGSMPCKTGSQHASHVWHVQSFILYASHEENAVCTAGHSTA